MKPERDGRRPKKEGKELISAEVSKRDGGGRSRIEGTGEGRTQCQKSGFATQVRGTYFLEPGRTKFRKYISDLN